MAKLKGMPVFTGSMGHLSAYTMRGVDGIILREKGGPRKEQIKKSPRFEMTRYRNEEWRGSMKGVRLVNLAMQGVRHLYDYSCNSTLSTLCRSIQDDDNINKLGCRSVLFSQSSFKLEGFGLNMYHPFDSVLKHPLQYEIDAGAGTALVELPDIIPGLHLMNPMKQPLYRILFVLGAVADVVYDAERKMYRPAADVINYRAIVQTAWHTSNEKTGSQQLPLAINNWQPQAGVSLVLSAGVEFGQPVAGGEIRFTKYAGAGKVLRVV
jgi:hypothetical protein